MWIINVFCSSSDVYKQTGEDRSRSSLDHGDRSSYKNVMFGPEPVTNLNKLHTYPLARIRKSLSSDDLILQFQKSLRRKIKSVACSSQLQSLDDEHIGTTSVEQNLMDSRAIPKIGQTSMGRSDEDDDGYAVIPLRNNRVQSGSFLHIAQVSLGHSDEDDDGYICVTPKPTRSAGASQPISSFDHQLPGSANDASIQLPMDASSSSHKAGPFDSSDHSTAADTYTQIDFTTLDAQTNYNNIYTTTNSAKASCHDNIHTTSAKTSTSPKNIQGLCVASGQSDEDDDGYAYITMPVCQPTIQVNGKPRPRPQS